jgi:hypothetical protein
MVAKNIARNFMIGSKKGRGNPGRFSVTDEFPLLMLDYAEMRFARAGLFFTGKGDERDVSASLYCRGDFPLMPCAVARNPSGQDLTAFGNEESQRFDVLVIDKRRFIYTEATNFLSNLEPPPFVTARTLAAIISIAPVSRIRPSVR